MAYKALYRTYRPNSFDEVYGQQHIVQTLKHAVEQNKIAHAYLFCGPRGTGKTSIAKIFAKTINCTDEQCKPCLHCDNCLAVQNGSHPDIIEIDAASNNGVEEVRNLIEKVKYAPLKGKYKVYIIDEVHMMTQGAFNALLKTIEEPPKHVIFIMATTEPHKVLPTIISRCQRFDFTKISEKEIEDRLRFVLKKENISCDDKVIRLIAQLSDGGMRDALSILDQCIAYAQNNIEEHHINEIYGITTVTEKIDILDAIIEKDAYKLLDYIDKFIEKGIDIKRLTFDLIEILKESIIFEYTKAESLLHILNIEEVNHIIDKLTRTKRFQMIHLLMETYDKYRTAANAGSYLEVCLLQMLDDTIQNKNVDTINTEIKTNSTEQNVSRETLKKKTIQIPDNDEKYTFDIQETKTENPKDEKIQLIENKKEIKPLNDEFVLGLLSGANKPEKAKDMNQLYKLPDMMMDIHWAKYANLLKHSMIVASGTNYVVVSVSNQAEANEINEMDQNDEFCSFTIELFGKSKKIFAISKEYQKYIVNVFKEHMTNGTLPKPIQIETRTSDNENQLKKTQEETILDLFGEDNIIITEE